MLIQSCKNIKIRARNLETMHKNTDLTLASSFIPVTEEWSFKSTIDYLGYKSWKPFSENGITLGYFTFTICKSNLI